jgi:hypothetical protein
MTDPDPGGSKTYGSYGSRIHNTAENEKNKIKWKIFQIIGMLRGGEQGEACHRRNMRD